MKKRCLFFAALSLILINLFTLQAVSAKDEWIRVKTKNFNLIGNASESEIRKVATRLEQFRETFRQLFSGANLVSPIETNVVVFKSASAYKPFKPKRADGKIDTNIAGYFQPGEDVNYITLSTEGEDSEVYGTIFHEYVHFIVNTNFGKSDVPAWFNEGLAEYYQTFSIEEDQKVKLGVFQQDHIILLNQAKLIPLDTLFNISNYALHQNGNHSRSIFYAQSWALMHYLIQSKKSEGLGKFLNALLKDVPPDKAFQESFLMTYQEMEKELRKYISQSSYQYQLVTFKKKLVFDNEMEVSPLSEAESNAYLGDLLYRTNRPEDAEAILRKALALDPNSSMANSSLGLVKMRQRKFDEAKSFLEKAVASEHKSHLAYYRYAYLLSRENRDEFGFVSSFPTATAAKMREMLQKAIAINPLYTESYELLAFISLVNNELLDEAVGYLQKALKYQPGNQGYALRIAEIYSRQEKYKEAAAIAEKIARTADEPETKAKAEGVMARIRQFEEFAVKRDESRKNYDSAIANAQKSGGRITLARREAEKPPTPEEIARLQAEARMRSLNQAVRKPEATEKQVIGKIQKIDCKGKTIFFNVKTADANLTLTSPDFENLALVAFVEEAEKTAMGCATNYSKFTAVLTYKPAAKGANQGQLIAVDFVPDDFKYVDTKVPEVPFSPVILGREDKKAQSAPSENPRIEELPPSPAAAGNQVIIAGENQDFEKIKREAMMQMIRSNLRQPSQGETRAYGFLEKIECDNKGQYFVFKSNNALLRLTSKSPQTLHIRGFTPEIESIQFGCNLSAVDIPVVFIYKPTTDSKKIQGEIIALEFVPKSFKLEN